MDNACGEGSGDNVSSAQGLPNQVSDTDLHHGGHDSLTARYDLATPQRQLANTMGSNKQCHGARVIIKITRLAGLCLK